MRFELLCSLLNCAISSVLATAARIPLILFAVIDIPIPVPRINTPWSHSLLITALPTLYANSG